MKITSGGPRTGAAGPAAIPRRTALATGLAVLLTGCSAPPAPAPAPAPDPDLAALEARTGGRIGLHVVDTGTGRTLGYRADERFLMCSVAKAPTVGAVLRRAQDDPALLDRSVRYTRAQLVEYSPVTGPRAGTGMTVRELCAAALTVSDNTAENLLLGVLGGPGATTAFVRSLGDRVTRMDRSEPTLNDAAPGDERDTTTPAAMAGLLRGLMLGDALAPPGRDLLTGWLLANTTGAQQIRAGLPAGWRTADKTGSGSKGESNDVAVSWGPGRAPWVITVFTAPARKDPAAARATIAEATRVVARRLGGA